MKNIIYAFLFVTLVSLLFLNNARGPAAAQNKGYTGAPIRATKLSENTCQQCHVNGTFNSSAKLEAFDSTGTTAVTSYQLGKVYTLRLTISVGSGTPTGYGFQMIDIRKSDSTNVKGFLPKASQATDIGVDTINDTEKRVYAGHNARLTTNVINVKWRAPATAGRGVIVFYAAGNAVNGNSAQGGDNGTNSVNVELKESTSSTNDLATKVNILISPNPTANKTDIWLKSDEARSLQVRLTDMTGRIVVTDNWKVTSGDNQKSLDLTQLAKGAYLIQLIDNQDIISKKIIKL